LQVLSCIVVVDSARIPRVVDVVVRCCIVGNYCLVLEEVFLLDRVERFAPSLGVLLLRVRSSLSAIVHARVVGSVVLWQVVVYVHCSMRSMRL